MSRKRLFNKYIKDVLITLLVIALTIGTSFLLEKVFFVWEHITTTFVFAVFLVSLLTDGYVYGMIATAVGVLFINFAFTFPYFHFDFSAPESIFSAVVMVIISVITSTLTTKLKKWQKIKAQGEREMMRANLLRAVSHDLRTPLTTIYGSSSAIIDNSETLTDNQKISMVEGIKEDAEWLIRMVENLLSITKIDKGRAKILKSPTVLEELIDSVILKFRKRYPTQTVNIEIPENIVVISMDAILIEQVIVNMLENAVKHAIGMTELKLTVSEERGQAIFEITDNGCGIDEERIEKILIGYYNSDESVFDSEKRNAGIGLSVCSTIIKAHDGKIVAENCKEGGAVFRFSLKTESLEGENNVTE